jgi:MOSC domain-containing protein YiiM
MIIPPDSPLGRLLGGPVKPGRLIWIGVRPSRRSSIRVRSSAMMIAGKGLDGDHYDTQRNGPRQVTLIAAEDLAAIASFLKKSDVAPEILRRNLVTSGINLLALKQRRFCVGEAILDWSGDCAPCSYMEEALGAGGYNAVRGHGGITARVVQGGEIRLGDVIERSDAPIVAVDI